MKKRSGDFRMKLCAWFMCVCMLCGTVLPWNAVTVSAAATTVSGKPMDYDDLKVSYTLTDEDDDNSLETLTVYSYYKYPTKEEAQEGYGDYYFEESEWVMDYKTNAKRLWYNYRPGITNVIFEEGSNYISWGMFEYSTSLESITLPDTIKSVDSYAFQYCTKLKSIVIPEGIKYIGYCAFQDCTSLEKVVIPESTILLETYGLFENCTNLVEVTLPANVILGDILDDNKGELESDAFYNCTSLKKVTLPNVVTALGNNVFRNCSSLENITLPDTVTSIGKNCFEGSGLTSITIPDAVTSIGEQAFGYDADGNAVPFTMYASCNNTAAADYAAANANITLIKTHSFTDKVSAEKVSDATCVKQAVYKVQCDHCDVVSDTETVAVGDLLPHTLTAVVAKNATCTENGNNAYWTCSTCGKVFADAEGQTETTIEEQTIEAKGHALTKTEAKEATCTEAGNNAYWTCSTCGKVFADAEGQIETTVAEQTLEAKGHALTKTETKEATCTEEGNNAYWTCSTCGKVFADAEGQTETTVEAETIKVGGHTLVKTDAKEATCSESGNNAYWTCSTCGKVFADAEGQTETTVEAETIEANGHYCFSVLGLYGYCVNCHTWVKVVRQGESAHVWNLGRVTRPATCTEPGVRTYTCYGCGETRTEEIPAFGHVYVRICGHTFCANCGEKAEPWK